MGRLVVVSGAGTEVGKTHVGVALLLALGGRAVGYKPVESGVTPDVTSDVERLAAASTFHVKHLPHYSFPDPIGPHLAAERHNIHIRLYDIVAACERLRDEAEFLLVELPGGLFSPFHAQVTNADVVRRLDPDALVVVGSDRLGALHDSRALFLAAQAVGLRLDALLLSAPNTRDLSTGTNVDYLRGWLPCFVAALPRAPSEALASHPAILECTHLLRGAPPAPPHAPHAGGASSPTT